MTWRDAGPVRAGQNVPAAAPMTASRPKPPTMTADPLGQPAAPAELGTHYVGGGGQQDGQGDHCGGDEPTLW
jgi:hypothetical protein